MRPVYFLLRRILATAVVDGLIARNPCVEVEAPGRRTGRRILFLTQDPTGPTRRNGRSALSGADLDRGLLGVAGW